MRPARLELASTEIIAMALPGRDKTFAFENCRDVLAKLEREISRFRMASNHDQIDDMKDIAFNASVTAWHLCDWVFHDLTPTQRESLQVHDLKEMQTQAHKCRPLYLCEQVANASKHWQVTRRHDPDVAIVVTATPH